MGATGHSLAHNRRNGTPKGSRGALSDQRHRLARFSAEILVLVLLATAVVSYQFELGERWFGWHPADPATDPSAVLPPEGLRLPAAGAGAGDREAGQGRSRRSRPGGGRRTAAAAQAGARSALRRAGHRPRDGSLGLPGGRDDGDSCLDHQAGHLGRRAGGTRADGQVPYVGPVGAEDPAAGPDRRRRPVPRELTTPRQGRLPQPRGRADPCPPDPARAALAEGPPGPARVRRLLLHGPCGQPGLARELRPRRRGPPDQLALGRPGAGPGRDRLPCRPGSGCGSRCSGPHCATAVSRWLPRSPARLLRRRHSTWPRSPAHRSARSSSARSRSATTRLPRCWPATSGSRSGRRDRSRRARRP